MGKFVNVAAAMALLAATSSSAFKGPRGWSEKPKLIPRQLPADPTDVTTITSPSGVKIHYKEPGKAGVCETTPGVNSYCKYFTQYHHPFSYPGLWNF